jgi:hypothetical protein
MNLSILLYVGLSVAVVVTLALMLRGMRAAKTPPPALAQIESHEPFPAHCRYFPQIRQALSPDDAEFVTRRLSAPARRQWRAERRRVLRQYLAGLNEDFAGLERLARTVALLSPQVNRSLEAERFWLGVRFRFLHTHALLRLEVGFVTVPEFQQLTELLGGFAAQVEAGMTALEPRPAGPLDGGFTA